MVAFFVGLLKEYEIIPVIGKEPKLDSTTSSLAVNPVEFSVAIKPIVNKGI